jgi:exodeoxyribonuclease VII large subunit
MRGVRDLLEHRIPLLWITGEVSSFSSPRSGHWYFILKDAHAQVRCVMFRARNQHIDWQPRDGMQVEVQALATLYEARGEFQLTVESMRQAGAGSLYERFLRLRDKLAGEGLFDAASKRSLPAYPRAIGVVSSLDGAALHDILSTLRRRNPSIRVIVYPASVQGDRAGDELAAAVQAASRRTEVEVLIIARGGGSFEDLWSFNSERLARAIRACTIPVVAGIGHETDFTIADFAADVRAPTPTAAAELASPAATEIVERARALFQRGAKTLRHQIEQQMQRVDGLSQRVVHPAQRLAARERLVRGLALRLTRCATRLIAQRRRDGDAALRRLRLARPTVAEQMRLLRGLSDRLRGAARDRVPRAADRLAALTRALEHLHPDRVLERGYCIASDAQGRIVSAAKELHPGDALDVRFSQGQARTRVESTGLD